MRAAYVEYGSVFLVVPRLLAAAAFLFGDEDFLSPSAISASSRNLGPLLGLRFPLLSQARLPSGPLMFERGLTHSSFEISDVANFFGFDFVPISA